MSDQPNANACTADFEFDALSGARNYRLKLVAEFRAHLRGNVLELGAGIGQITEELAGLSDVRRLLSVEPDESFCSAFRARLPHGELLQGTIESLLGDSAWDAIVSINVLEHIEKDTEELAAYHRLLHKNGGTLCLFVPARPEIYAPIDSDFGHFRRYRKRDLELKLAECGFKCEKIRYYNLLGYFAWWASFCLLKKRSFDAASVRLFDRAFFPVVYFLETHVCPPPIGQSLLVIAKAG